MCWQRTLIPLLILVLMKQSDRFCGLAEMSGPYDPQAKAPNWERPWDQAKGIIPIRWLVVKDVPFSAFEDLTHSMYRSKTFAVLDRVA